MSLPIPVPGLVIRYGFLWSHERAQGRTEAVKDRPGAIVVAARRDTDGAIVVTVAPITHEPPADSAASIEIPVAVRRQLGLDDQSQWLRMDELNRFTWPGCDLHPVPGEPRSYHYGMLPKAIYEVLKEGILKRHAERQRIAVALRD